MRVTVLGLSDLAAADRRKCCATWLIRAQEHTTNIDENTAYVNACGGCYIRLE
jgi:hypothetical protein